jgi:hypothetical protein
MNLRIVRDGGDDDEDRPLTPDIALPFHKDGSDTERAAARKARKTAKGWRDKCLLIMQERHPKPMTPDQCAEILGKDPARGIRARFTDMKKFELIEDTGLRALNAEGNLCTLWRLTEKGLNT